MNNKIIKNAVVNALLTALYVIAIASFLSYAPDIFGKDKGEPESILVPIVMLLLLVLSAAITGSLVFGRPAMWYFDGQKKEALTLLAYTLVSLFVITIIALFALYILVS